MVLEHNTLKKSLSKHIGGSNVFTIKYLLPIPRRHFFKNQLYLGLNKNKEQNKLLTTVYCKPTD